jgi:hypothetical protein
MGRDRPAADLGRPLRGGEGSVGPDVRLAEHAFDGIHIRLADPAFEAGRLERQRHGVLECIALLLEPVPDLGLRPGDLSFTTFTAVGFPIRRKANERLTSQLNDVSSMTAAALDDRRISARSRKRGMSILGAYATLSTSLQPIRCTT